MATLPIIQCPTLAAADAALERAENGKRTLRQYLGMSELGRECERQLWYNFRWVSRTWIKASGLKKILDGHAAEDVQAQRLRMVDGITLLTLDADTGKQFAFQHFGGHASGHMDGAILGVLQAPKTWHVWEHKSVAEAKFRKLEKLKIEYGEKQAFRQWDETYYAQGVLYMHFSGMSRHFLTVSTPGVRDSISCRTEENPEYAEILLNKAQRIIFSERPPARISSDPNYYQCGWCDHRETCHGHAIPEKSCRTCIHVTPEQNGTWTCADRFCQLSIDEQRAGCDRHLFNPYMINAKQTSCDDSSISYTKDDGGTFINFRGGVISANGPTTEA